MQKSAMFLLLFLLSTGMLFSQRMDRQIRKSIDNLVAPHFKPNEPGIAILVAKKGKIIYEQAFGSAQVELNVPMQPDMVFRVGSITKQFTAVGILQLAEQGKLSLQDSVQQYVKGFPYKGHTITIEHLLTHTAGLKDYMAIDHPDPYIERHDFTPQFLIDHFKNAPLEFKPGTQYGYSNSGYVLLAYIIEVVSGQKYHAYMREQVLKPAGLKSTYYASENAIIPKRAAGYTRDNGSYENTYQQSISIGYGCGDLLSTVEDLYQWNTALWQYKLLKKETLEKACTPYTLSNGNSTGYGYGWFNNEVNGSSCIHHEGQVSGFISVEQYFPAEDLFVAILTNVKSGEDKTDFSNKRFELFNDISLSALGKPTAKELKLSDVLLDGYVGTYNVDSLATAHYSIYKKDNQLIMELPKQGRFPLIPVAKNRFRLKSVSPEAILEFIKNSEGKVVKLVIVQKGKYEWVRVSTPTDSLTGNENKSLAIYAGKYQRPAMRDAINTICVQDGQLFMETSTGIPKVALLPVADNRFKVKTSRFELEVEFVRNTKGGIEKVVTTQHTPVEMIKLK
jgi:CubicO group peptidase (beta-lactamase class C family)